MMPDNALSTASVPSAFIGARALASHERVDYEEGPIAIGDVSQGMQAIRWRMRLINGEFWLDSPTTPEFVALAAPGASELSFTFDQQARVMVCYVQDGVPRFYWYDPTIPGYTVTDLPADAITPKIILDDKRTTQIASSDIVMMYIRGGRLKMRVQRERFTIEHDLDAGPWTAIAKLGFNRGLRLQVLCRYV